MPLFNVERMKGLKHCAWLALAFLLARACMNVSTRKWLDSYRKRKGLKESTGKLQEELWLIVCGSGLSLFSLYMVTCSPYFERCNLFNTSECFQSFESEDVPKLIKGYYLTEVGWYVSLVLKPVFGVGRFDSLAMEFHHFVTLALIIWSYTTGFTQIVGVVTFCIFNQSNPWLHFSKLANYLEWKTGRVYLFVLFALTFFVTRIVLLPLIVIQSTYFKMPLAVTAEEWSEAVVYTWFTTNAFLITLWLLNIYWLKPIIRLFLRNLTGLDKGDPQDNTITREEVQPAAGNASTAQKKQN